MNRNTVVKMKIIHVAFGCCNDVGLNGSDVVEEADVSVGSGRV